MGNGFGSLYIGASGLQNAQYALNTTANNLANVNTTGYKSSTAEFKSLLYQTIQTKTTSANGENKPVGAQVGLGVRTSAIATCFNGGSLLESTNDFAFALEGDGFFAVRGADGETYYTRNGDFNVSLASDNILSFSACASSTIF